VIQAIVTMTKAGPVLIAGSPIEFEQEDLDDAAAMGQFPPDLWRASLDALSEELTTEDPST
jgi:hypothetical protein